MRTCAPGFAPGHNETPSQKGVLRVLAVARCTLGYASVETMFSQLSRASLRGSLSLAVPLALPRLKRCALSSLEPRSEKASCRGSLSLAVPLAMPRLKQCSLSSLEPRSERASFRGSLSLSVPFAMPRLKRCSLSSYEPRSERALFRASLIQRLAVARCTLGYASVEAMLS